MEGAAVHQGEVYVMLRPYEGLGLAMIAWPRTEFTVYIIKDLPKEEAKSQIKRTDMS